MVSPGMGRTKLLSACVIAVCVAVAIVTLAVSGSLRVRPTVLATERLFDVDGPSLRDPPRAAWNKGGKGTAAWMEDKKPVQVLSQKAHSRGRRDRFFDAMIRHAPREVSEVLDIPMAKVQKLEHRVAKKMVREFKTERKARAMHAVHRGMLKGMGSMMLAEAINVTDMSECGGKYKKCDALAENILEVAKAINANCATLYFNEKAYYKCEAELAEPVCKQVDRDFPQMCGPDGMGYAGKTGYSVEHGYFGSESPANIHGAFCNGCAQIERAGGCFALGGMVDVAGKGPTAVGQVVAGDSIAGVAADGSPVYSRVVFTHEHVDSMLTVKLSVGGGVIELTPAHQVPVFTHECGGSYCAAARLVKAEEVAPGTLVYASDGVRSAAHAVSAVAQGRAHVKYLVTETGNLVVDGVVASVFSTMGKQAETMPFLLLDTLAPGSLQWPPVKAALHAALESPFLRLAESALDAFLSRPTRHCGAGAARLAVGALSI